MPCLTCRSPKFCDECKLDIAEAQVGERVHSLSLFCALASLRLGVGIRRIQTGNATLSDWWCGPSSMGLRHPRIGPRTSSMVRRRPLGGVFDGESGGRMWREGEMA